MKHTRCTVCDKPIEKEESVKRGMGPVCFRKMLKERDDLEVRLFEINCLVSRKGQILPQDGTEVKQVERSSSTGTNRP